MVSFRSIRGSGMAAPNCTALMGDAGTKHGAQKLKHRAFGGVSHVLPGTHYREVVTALGNGSSSPHAQTFCSNGPSHGNPLIAGCG